jgi:hypothetical protein
VNGLTNKAIAESLTMSMTTSLLFIKTKPAAPSGYRPRFGMAHSRGLLYGQLSVSCSSPIILSHILQRACSSLLFQDGLSIADTILSPVVQPEDIKLSFIKRINRRVLMRLDHNVYSSEYKASRQMTAGGHFVLAFRDEDGKGSPFPKQEYRGITV